MKRILVSTLLCFLMLFAFGQDAGGNLSWKKKKKIAENFLEQGDFASAGQYFRSAWKSKTSMPELAFSAGEAFFKIRDYLSAAQAYEPIKENREEFNIAGLKYASCLKLSGQYDDAIRAFDGYIDNYKGEDIEETKALVAKEIKGCKLGKKLQKEEPSKKTTIEHLNYMINSTQVEFNPRAASKDKLFFSSVEDGKAGLFYSEKVGNKWNRRRKLTVRGLEFPHSGNIAFAPSGENIYFTQCDVNIEMETLCAIYTAKKTEYGFSEPTRLPAAINATNSTNTHPYIYASEGKEILLFTSNRDGGEGGMDLYYAYRNVDSPSNAFSDAQNLGVKINTEGDEGNAYFDPDTKTLFFSSNGHVSIGGFDIFKANGTVTSWDRPENLGLPFNSCADDLYYSEVLGTNTAFLVSNRVVMPDKISTNDDDIFLVRTDNPQVLVNGYATISNNPDDILEDVKVTLYEVLPDSSLFTINTKSFKDGFYQFKLKPSKSYRIEAEKGGFLNAYFDMKTYDIDKSIEINQDIPMEDVMIASKPPVLTPEQKQSIAPDGDGAISDITIGDTKDPVTFTSDPALKVEVDEMESELIEKVEAPFTEEPELEVPRIEMPEIDVPITTTPVVEAPVLEEELEVPSIEMPTVEKPVTETPVVEAPVLEEELEVPSIEMPTVEKPVTETPVVEAPVLEEELEVPSIEMPTVEKPVTETPVVEAPVLEKELEVPSIEMPTVEEPVVERPPVVEAPALEEPVAQRPEIIEPTVQKPIKIDETVVSAPKPETVTSTPIASSEINTSNSLEDRIESSVNAIKAEGGIDNNIYDYPKYSGSVTSSMVPTTSSANTIISEPAMPESVSASSSKTVKPREYKIQLAAVADYVPARYQNVENVGQVVSLEGIDTDTGYLTRVLVDGFTSSAEAAAVLDQLQAAGFPRAFMVRYDNGVRNQRSMRR